MFDITVEGNRPDAWCITGIARDLAARLHLDFGLPDPPEPASSGLPVAEAVVAERALPHPAVALAFADHAIRTRGHAVAAAVADVLLHDHRAELRAEQGTRRTHIQARCGGPKAVVATARKIAERVYRLLKYGAAYVRQEMAAAEEAYRARLLKGLARKATELGYRLVPTTS